jgi:hypothetical protein
LPVVTRRIQFAPDQPWSVRPVSKRPVAGGEALSASSQVLTVHSYASPSASAGPEYGT